MRLESEVIRPAERDPRRETHDNDPGKTRGGAEKDKRQTRDTREAITAVSRQEKEQRKTRS